MEERDLVNRESLLEVTDGEPEMMRQIINLYLEQTGKQLNALATAVREKNASEIYRLAHKSLGSSATCGITGMISPLTELETMGRDGELENAEQTLVLAQQTYHRVIPFLEKILSEVKEK